MNILEHSSSRPLFTNFVTNLLIFFFAFYISHPALAQDQGFSESSQAAANVLSDGRSNTCPSSEAAAKKWATRLLAPSELFGNLEFISAPYPLRDPQVAKEILIQKIGSITNAKTIEEMFYEFKLSPMQRRDFITTSPLDYSRPVGSTAINRSPLKEDVYRFIVDEGCANLTVWHLGVFSDAQTIKEIRLVRSFDDSSFETRNLEFSFKYFDFPKFDSSSFIQALSSLIKHEHDYNKSEFEKLSEILAKAGAEPFVCSARPDNRKVCISEYVPTYIDFDRRAWRPWIISVSVESGDGKVIEMGSVKYGGIKDINPDLFLDILLILIMALFLASLLRLYLRSSK